MGSADPEGVILAAKVLGALAVTVGPAWGVWVWLDKRFEKKAEKHQVNNQFQEVKTEAALHRTYFKDVFEKMEQHARRDEDLFREVMKKMGDNHAELLRELGHKADR